MISKDRKEVISVIEQMIRSHFQECEGPDGEKYLADTDHGTIEEFMDEIEDWLK